MASTFGEKLRISIFGQSHGDAIGVTIEGLPAGEDICMEELYTFLQRRAPGKNDMSTTRREADMPRFVSGIMDGKTAGAPLCAIIENTSQRSKDYEKLADIPRPGHADYTARLRYGEDVDMRGGGHFSGRLTAPLCIAGGIAKQILARRGIHVGAHIAQIGGVHDTAFDPVHVSAEDFEKVLSNFIPVLDAQQGEAMHEAVLAARNDLDSVGGQVECAIIGMPKGLGDPMFDGVENRIARAVYGIPAVKALEFGAGTAYAAMHGSQANDPFYMDGEDVKTSTNNCGGILGGITNGMPIVFTATFKPTPSIAKPQKSVSLSNKQDVTLEIHGRHDPCIVQRAVPVVEAAAACVMLDMILSSDK